MISIESSVVLLLIDGLRPDALLEAHCPNLDDLHLRAAYTLCASSVMPSITLPCLVSVFHSAPPTRHRVTTNDWGPMAQPLPGLVDLVHAAGLYTASVYNWEPLRDLSRPGSLAFSYFRDNLDDPDGDQVIADEAARLIAGDRPDFMFVYFGTLDIAGHNHGWMSDEYLAQLERVDGAAGTLLDALPDDVTVLLTSDHGGHDRSHGTDFEIGILDAINSYLQQSPEGTTTELYGYALHEVTGTREGRSVRHILTTMHPPSDGTVEGWSGLRAYTRSVGVPFAIGADLIVQGMVNDVGAMPPEQAFSPAVVFEALEKRGIIVHAKELHG